MNALPPDSAKYWKWLFLILETVLVVGYLYLTLGGRFFGSHIERQSQVWSLAMGIPIMFAWMFLLVASPFFLRSLRGIALAGWIIAFGILLIGALSAAL